MPDIPFDDDKKSKAEFIRPPENAGMIRMKAQAFLVKLRQSPAFIKKAEDIRDKLYQRLQKGNTPLRRESPESEETPSTS